MTGRGEVGRFVVERFGHRWAVCDLARPTKQVTVHDSREQAQAAVERLTFGTRRRTAPRPQQLDADLPGNVR